MRELFLFCSSGIQYGIGKDEILSVRDLHALHRIPLSPARIAGILSDGDRTVTLADLPACIGYESGRGIEQGCILLKEEGDKIIGFVVSGELRIQSIPPESLLPLPDYLKSPVLDSCAVHDDIPIPLINFAELYSRALKPDEESCLVSPSIPGAQPQDISAIDQIRFIAAGGEIFAVSAAGIEDKAVKPGPITPIPNMPPYVRGVTFWKGRLLSVIDLSQRITWQGGLPQSQMLIAEIGGAAFGLLIDSDDGMVSADMAAIKPAPFIARSAWLKHVAVRAGEPIPLIDLAMALSPGAAGEEKPLWQRYAPDPVFLAQFFKRDVEVVEFSLLGERYALPKVDVEDVIAYKPSRTLPDVPSIVLGVAEHEGEIFPVVDLAMMFGRRSLTTPAWRMMLVNNGDFRALVITETVFGERRLAPEIHRAVPIHLPHNLMYGCYPDDKAVRIILNVEAISVHFEKSMISKFMPALSHEMRTSPSGKVYAFPDKKTAAETIVQARVEEEPIHRAEPAPAAASAAAFSAADAEDPAAPEQVQHAAEENIAGTQEPVNAAPKIASEPEPEPEQTDVVQAATHTANTQGSLSNSDECGAGDHDQALSDKTTAPETHAAAEPAEPAAPRRNAATQQPSGESSRPRDAVAMSEPPTGKILKFPAQQQPAQQASADNRTSKPVTAAASARPSASYRMSREVEQLAVLSGHEEQAVRTRKRNIALGAIAAALLAVFLYFPGTSDKPDIEKSPTGAESAKLEPDMALTQQANAQIGLPRSAEKSRAPLELDIPKHMPPLDIDIYVVQEGDTLWSISERFTGSPFNYPRIAGENKIAEPDLIFPGQRVRLIK